MVYEVTIAMDEQRLQSQVSSSCCSARKGDLNLDTVKRSDGFRRDFTTRTCSTLRGKMATGAHLASRVNLPFRKTMYRVFLHGNAGIYITVLLRQCVARSTLKRT